MQVRKANRFVLAAAAAVVGLSFTEAANAQLNYGDVVTVNSFFNTSQGGRIYRVEPNGTATQIGSEWGWNDRPLAVLIENRNTALVAFGTHQSYSSYNQGIYRVNLTTGNRTHLAWMPNNYPVTDIEVNPSNGKIYVSSGLNWRTTGQTSGFIHEFNSTTGAFTQIWSSGGWNRIPQQMAINPTNPNLMVFAASQNSDTQSSEHYNLNLSNNSVSSVSSSGWNVRREGLEYTTGGQLYGSRGNPYVGGNWGYNNYLDTVNSSLDTTGTPWNFGWEQFPHKLAFDEGSGIMYFGTSDSSYSNGSYTSYLRSYNTTNGSTNNVWSINNQYGVMDLGVVSFGLSSTGQNNITIGGSTSNVTGSPNFRAENSDATLNPSSLLNALTNNPAASVRPGIGGSNNQDGNVTLAVALNYEGVGDGKTLTLRARNNLTLNGAIADSDTGSPEMLNLVLVADNDNVSGLTGVLDINGAINTSGGSFTARGNTFDNTSSPITAGAVSITGTDSLAIADTINGTTVAFTSGGAFNVNAAVTGTTSVNMTSTGDTTISADVTGGSVAIASSAVTTVAAPVSGTTVSISGGTVNLASTVAGSTSISLTSSGEMTISADLTGADLSINSAGLTTTAPITASGQLTLNNSGDMSLGAPVSAGTLDLGSSTLELSAELSVSVALGDTGAINILADGLLGVSELSASLPDITIDGGTFAITGTDAIPSGESITFNTGTVQIAGDRTYSSSSELAQRLLGSSVSGGQTVIIDGTMTLNSAFSLSGGRLSVGGLENGYNLSFNGGTLEFSGGAFQVTDGAMFGDLLVMNSGKTIAITNSATATIEADGYVMFTGSGRLVVDSSLVNNGEIMFASATSRLQGVGTFTNNALVQGTGRIDISDTINSSTGVFRVSPGQAMRFTTGISNSGRIEIQGGSFETTSLNNDSGSVVTMSGGATLRMSPNAPSFNSGSMLISGNADVYGDLTNNSGGVVRLGGGGTVNFFDDVINSGNFEIAGGSVAFFFGTLDPGTISGFGTVVIFGGLGLRIGHNDIGADVSMSDSAMMTMQIGTATEYSSLSIDGEGQLGGTLVVTETGNRYLGAVYELITADSLVGQFSNVILPAPGMGMNYELQYNGNSVMAVVVPEPATLSALAGLAALGLRRRR